MSVNGKLLTVRETAQALNVHENTVRNWARSGELPDARLPGSRFLRFRASDVERLIAQRGARTPSLQSERRAVNPEFVTANQLKQWPSARPRNAQESFPELVRRLLVETPGITNISIRSGDGIALAGWDGFADSDGTAFLPAGPLAFEFGVGGRPKLKATYEYNRHVSSVPSPKTFVFATPQRWVGGSEWAQERARDGHFADVKVLDADDLEGWLHAAPSALYWISEHLGLRPREAMSLDTWWERFSGSTNPPLPLELFLAGRRREAMQLVERLAKDPALTILQSEWSDDCLAFLRAALSQQAQDAPLSTTALLVSTNEAWDSILDKRGHAALIPLFEDADVGRAVDKGHHVITVVDRSAVSRRTADISLPRPARREAAEALQAVGIDLGRADRLAAQGRRSMPALRRYLSVNPKFTRPDWAQAGDARILAPLMLVGSWTSDGDDIKILEAVSGEHWATIEPLLLTLSTSSDPVIRNVGGSWSYASPEEAFLFLHRSLTKDMLERIAEAATRVLCAPDPILDLVPGERGMAGLLGVRRPYSSALRNGLAQGLALLGSMDSDVQFYDGSTQSDVVARTIQRLLGNASADKSGRLWHQLADVLSLLAEAAPTAFIRAVEDDLDQTKPVVLSLFQDENGQNWSLGPPSRHPHMLWALETLCWSSEYLIDGIRILARLACVDPGGKSGNRPISSLSSVLCGWARHTSASVDARLQALDAVYAVDEKVGWETTFELWPGNQGFVIPPASPRFRDWQPTDRDMPMSEWIEFTHRLVDRAIEYSRTDADRLGRLAEGIATVPSDDQGRIITLLEDRASSGLLDIEGRLSLWERLHALISHHGRFAAEAWALPAGIRARLSTVTASLQPTSDPQRYAYLFDWHPDLPGIDQNDFDQYGAQLAKLRIDALNSVLGSPDGIEALSRLASRAKSPAQLGWALAELDNIVLPQLLSWFSSPDARLTEAAANWVRRRVLLRGSQWLVHALREPALAGSARNLFLRSLPAEKGVWQALRESPVREDEQNYWTTAPFDALPLSDASDGLQQLIVHGRAWTAIGVASHAIHQAARDEIQQSGTVTPDLIAQVLDAALEQKPRADQLSSMTGYYIGELLDYLGGAAGFEMTIARCEFNFFRLLENHRAPTVLNTLLATQSEYFVDLVKHAYRGRNEPRRDLDQAEQSQATQAWWVLHSWKGFPGQVGDGPPDVDIMNAWVKAARLALSEADRSDIGDEMIGQTFADSPVGEDGAWPAEPVRDLLETIGSRELEHGFALGRMNRRGATSRDIYAGGHLERELVQQYREWSQMTRASWPRTARVLRELADSYEREARREDIEAERDADRG